MNLLPDMMIIDFCEWLKHTICIEHQDLDILDLMLNEQYAGELREYASLFLQQYNPSIKNIFHQFIESEYFDKSLNKCNRILKRYFDFPYKSCPDYEFIHCVFHEGCFDKSFYQFHKETYGNMECTNNETCVRNVRAQALADSSRFLFSHANSIPWIQEEKQWVLHFMNHLDLDLHIECDFLEWLIKTKGEPIDIRKMPLSVFEKLAEQFQFECNKSKKDKEKLIRTFKQKDLIVVSEKLLAILPIKIAKRAKDLGYIVDRYQDKSIPFKCFIMPLQVDSKEYKNLIENHWDDLHHLSGDYLDIYYTDVDYGKSGYEIMNRMNFIPDKLKTKAPIIVIWDTDLSKAQGIDISRLNNTDIFEVIRGIVNSIQNKYEFDKIVKEANQMSKMLREEHRAVSYVTTNNTINNRGTITGNVAAVNYGTMSASIEDISVDNLMKEIEEAKKIIWSFEDISKTQKQRLSTIMNETKLSVESKMDGKQQESKKSFKDAICFMGNVGVKLISALSGLANLLNFFGISSV